MRPRRPLLLALAGWTAIGLAAAWLPLLSTLWGTTGLLLAGAGAGDLVLLLMTRPPTVRRRVAAIIPQARWQPVELTLSPSDRRPLRLDCHDLHPADFDVRGQPLTLRLPPGIDTPVHYRIRAPRRGRRSFEGCELRLCSPLGLWSRLRRVGPSEDVKVYPRLTEVGYGALRAGSDRLAELGVRRRARRGSGSELHQLRDYRRGDTLRQIDWKATARVRRPIARELEDERDQRLLFLLDCGRHMRHVDSRGRGHLDEALNALLLLAQVAVRQGDAVGLMTYGGPRRLIPPRHERRAPSRLAEAVFDLEAGLEAADPVAAAADLLRDEPRRTLVLMVTNSRDEDHAELGRAVDLLRRRHLVVIADLRESILDDVMQTAVTDAAAARRFLGVEGYLAERRRRHKRLQHLGAHVLDLPPSRLPIALVEHYIEVKRGGLL